MITDHDLTGCQRIHIKGGNVTGSAVVDGQTQHLVEVTVVELSIPAD
jgi:hypothetical protein